MDHYAELGLKRGATKEAIRKAYRKLAMQWHPDLNPSPEAQQKFIRLTEAYEVLMDERPAAGASPRSSTTTAQQRSPQEKRRDDMRERLRKYAERRFAEFREERNEYRNSKHVKFYRFLFYVDAYSNYVFAAAVIAAPVIYAIYKDRFLWMLALVPLTGLAASFYFKGVRLKKKSDMIFGEREKFTMQELEDIFFYKGPRNPNW